MAILFIADNGGIGCAAWVLRVITTDVAEVLAEDSHRELAAWLSDDLWIRNSMDIWICAT
jgi:hypothetical protein